MKESPLKFLAFALMLFEGCLVVVASSISDDLQKYIIIALIAIPVAVLSAFFYLLSYQTHKLYAPSDFKDERSFLSNSDFRKNAQKITDTASSKIRDIVAAQIETLSVYHDLIINNPRRSFQSAFASAIVGVIFLIVSVSFVIFDLSRDASIISTISGALIEVIAGINFYLYHKASTQLAEFQSRLETIQRYVLADAICESLDNEYQQRARSMLVLSITGMQTTDEFQNVFGKLES